jgi:hypothetical protein
LSTLPAIPRARLHATATSRRITGNCIATSGPVTAGEVVRRFPVRDSNEVICPIASVVPKIASAELQDRTVNAFFLLVVGLAAIPLELRKHLRAHHAYDDTRAEGHQEIAANFGGGDWAAKARRHARDHPRERPYHPAMQPTTIAWGGSYSIVDPSTQLTVRVLVSGRFDGTLANPASIEALKALVARAVGEAVASRQRSVLTLMTDKDTVIEGVRAQIAPALHDLGAQGQLSIDTVAFDEDSRKRLIAANAEVAKRVREKKVKELAEAEAAKAAAPPKAPEPHVPKPPMRLCSTCGSQAIGKFCEACGNPRSVFMPEGNYLSFKVEGPFAAGTPFVVGGGYVLYAIAGGAVAFTLPAGAHAAPAAFDDGLYVREAGLPIHESGSMPKDWVVTDVATGARNVHRYELDGAVYVADVIGGLTIEGDKSTLELVCNDLYGVIFMVLDEYSKSRSWSVAALESGALQTEMCAAVSAKYASRGSELYIFGTRVEMRSVKVSFSPSATASAPVEPSALAPGTHVLVQWSDGNRYPAVLQQSAQGQSLVAFPNGTEQWVPAHAVSKA